MRLDYVQGYEEPTTLPCALRVDKDNVQNVDVLPSLKTVEFLPCQYQELWADFSRVNILPKDIEGINGALVPKQGILPTTQVSSISFKTLLPVFSIFKVLEYRIKPVSAHRLFANSDMIIRSVIFPKQMGKSHGVMQPPSDSDLAKAWGALATKQGLPNHIKKFLEQPADESGLKKELKELNLEHGKDFNFRTGESSLGSFPPGLFDINDLWLGPVLTMSKLYNQNSLFQASRVQKDRYRNSKNNAYNEKGNSTEDSKTFRHREFLPSPAVFLSYQNEDISFESQEEVSRLHRETVFRYRKKYLSEAALGLNEGLLETYSSKFNQEYSRQIEGKLQHLIGANNSRYDEKIKHLSNRQNDLDEQQEAMATQVILNEQRSKLNAKENILTNNRLINVDPFLAINPKDPGIKSMVMDPTHFEEESRLAKVERENFEQVEKDVSNGHTFGRNIFPKIAKTNKTLQIPVLSDLKPPLAVLKFNELPAGRISLYNQNFQAGSNPTLMSNAGQAKIDSQVRASSIHYPDNLPEALLESSLSSISTPSSLSRNDLGAMNLPFAKILNEKVKPNFSERKAAYKRRYAFELVLTPYYKNKFEMIILLYLNELYIILDQLSRTSPNWAQCKQIKSEAEFVREQMNDFDYDEVFIKNYLNGECRNFETPAITFNLLSVIFEIFTEVNILIPYVGIPDRKSFLTDLFRGLDPLNASGAFEINYQSDITSASSIDSDSVETSRARTTNDPKTDLSNDPPESNIFSNLHFSGNQSPKSENSQQQNLDQEHLVVTIPDETPRYDFDLINQILTLNQNLTRKTPGKTPGRPVDNNLFSNLNYDSTNFSEPNMEVHVNDTDRVFAYGDSCNCKNCSKLREGTAVINDSAYLFPPSKSILDTIYLRKKEDSKFKNYVNHKIIPTINEIRRSHKFSEAKMTKIATKIENRKNARLKTIAKLNSSFKEIKSKQKVPKAQFIEILYTNLNNPLIQISKVTENASLCADVLCFSELRMDPIHIINKTAFGNNWDYFFHEPVIVNSNGQKRPMIFSLILINSDSNLVGTLKPSPAPITSVAITAKTNEGEFFTFNVSCLYRTHYDSSNFNVALQIYDKSCNNENRRIAHNQFYKDIINYTVTNFQAKVPSVFCGDLNLDFMNPRKTDSNDLCRSIQAIFAPYTVHSKKPTHYTHSRIPGVKKLVKSRIDFFISKKFPNDFQQINQFSGHGILNDGHSILKIRSNVPKLIRTNKITRTIRVLPDRDVLFRQSRRVFYQNYDQLKHLYESVLSHIENGGSYSHTNPYTSFLVSLLDDIIDSVTVSKTITIKTSQPKYDFSDYSLRLLEKISSLDERSLTRDLSDCETLAHGVYTLLLRMSVKEDSRKVFEPYVQNSELSTNDIFALNRFFNPKSKLSAGKTGDYSCDQLLNIYLETVDAKKNLPIDPSVDYWKDLKSKFSLDDLKIQWEGPTRGTSLKKSFQSCQPFAKGVESDLTRHALGFFCAEFSTLFVWMQETNLKCGRSPDFCRRSRLRQIPKLSAPDLTAIGARRFIAVSGVSDTGGEKHVSDAFNEKLEKEGAIPNWQNAFRKSRSTSTALADIFLRIQKLPKNHAKILISFDSTNAFGVTSPILLRKAIDSVAEGKMADYLKSLLEQKTVRVEDNGNASKFFTLPKDAPGVPQGKPTSPTLFSLLISALQEQFPNLDANFLSAFADDLSMVISMATMSECINEAKKAIQIVEKFMTSLGIKVNISKSNYMVFGPGSDVDFELKYKGETLKRVYKNKILGLRFNTELSVKPQIDWLISNRFPKHRGAINILMYAKNRIHLIGITNSLFYGQYQFSVEVWPRLCAQQGNKIAAEILNMILDIYGLPLRRENGKRYCYMEIFAMAGLQSPINIQDRSILNLANTVLIAKRPNIQLFDSLNEYLCIQTENFNFSFNYFSSYKRRVLLSVNLIKLHFSCPQHIHTFPGNMKIPIKNLPNDVAAHLGCKYKSFNRVCKSHFKYKCPHAQGTPINQCKNCIEKRTLINFVKRYIPSTAFQRFSIFYYASTFSISEVSLKKHINNTITETLLRLMNISEPL